jgi:hypothetical protein
LRPYFIILSIVSPIWGLCFGIKFRRNPIWIYLLVCFLFDLTVSIGKRYTALDVPMISNLFVVVEYLLVTWIYTKTVRENFVLLESIQLLLVVFLITTSINGFHVFNILAASLFHLAFLFYSLLCFFSLIKYPQKTFKDKSILFWCNVAFIIYGSGNFILFLFFDELKKTNTASSLRLWSYVHSSLNIFKNLMLAIALIKNKRN